MASNSFNSTCWELGLLVPLTDENEICQKGGLQARNKSWEQTSHKFHNDFMTVLKFIDTQKIKSFSHMEGSLVLLRGFCVTEILPATMFVIKPRHGPG